MRLRRIMRSSIFALSLLCSVSAQTFSNCNPTQGSSCPPDSALGRGVSVDFTKGASDSFTAQGAVTYDGSNGAKFTVSRGGDSPQLISKWYIMFGRVDVVVKAAPGAGIVSSFVLQSDTLDEIDWEWLGGDPDQVQSNFFGRGQTTSYNRGAFHPASGSTSGYKTYTVIWTADQIVWQINGQTVRAVTASSTNGYPFPQTPMQIKVGSWSGGDASNPQGTITWAKGPTDYSKGPFSMYVKSVAVQDYSTGTQYKYNGAGGTWQSIVSVGGKINTSGSGANLGSAAPAVTNVASGAPQAFAGRGTNSQSVTYTSYPGLPSGWTVTSSGKVVPPNSAGELRVSKAFGIGVVLTAVGAVMFGMR